MRTDCSEKKKIVIKVGTTSITHPETGRLDYRKMEQLVRLLSDLKNQGKEVTLVSSGAVAQGRAVLGLGERPEETAMKQACAAVGQGRLMMIYEKFFSEYGHIPAQILLTKDIMIDEIGRRNAENTFQKLLQLGVIPIVNENDAVATEELQYGDFGDNDTLSALVCVLVKADLLVLLTDIDGLYTDDPKKNPNAKFISEVPELTEEYFSLGKGTDSHFGTGGMATKLSAAKIATEAGADMVIANGSDLHTMERLFQGEPVGTWFKGNRREAFHMMDYMDTTYKKEELS